MKKKSFEFIIKNKSKRDDSGEKERDGKIMQIS